MRKQRQRYYLDCADASEATAVYIRDAEVAMAGTCIYSMSVRHRGAEYERWEQDYGIRFIFDDMQVEPLFYAVPRVDIFAVDGSGGYFGAVGQMEDDAPVCYFKDGKCYLVAENGAAFRENAADWRSRLRDFPGVTLYASREQAARSVSLICEGRGSYGRV